MNTLIIPCAGRSSRFPGMRPKWLLKYPDGKIAVKKAIEGINEEEFDRVIITIVKEHAIQYRADKVLEEFFDFSEDSKFELCILDDFTSCQAETVYMTLDRMHVKGSFAVKDSDNYIKITVPQNSDFVAGLDMDTFPQEIERLSGKSFLIVNSQNIITDIIEKTIVSQYISIGMYGFREVDVYCEAYEHLSSVEGMKGEIYLSHVISWLIGLKKSVYSYVPAQDYEDWGTAKDWYKMLGRKKTYMINVEGTLLLEKSGDDGRNLSEDNIAMLAQLSSQGAQIILLTSMSKSKMEWIEKILADRGVKVHSVVYDCYQSHQVMVKSYSSDIPYPACEGINIVPGGKLRDVLRNER